MFYEVLMEKKAYKRELAGAGLMATGMGLLHVGAKKDRAIRAESERLREEMRKREYASPEHKSLEKLRRLGTRRLPAEFRHGGDGDEYISKLTPAEEKKREALLDRLAENNRSYEDRVTANEKRRGGPMRGVVPAGMFLGGTGLLASSLFKKKASMKAPIMSYEKLAEASQEKKKRQGLSTKQKIGVGVAGAAGLYPGAIAAIKPALHNERYFDYLVNTKGRRKAEQLFMDGAGNIFEDYAAQEAAKRVADRRQKAAMGIGAAGGALALGYGAKKLFDRYNQRKQRKD